MIGKLAFVFVVCGLSVFLSFDVCAAESVGRESIVYVSAHPDDLGGSAGTLMLLARKYEVYVVDYTHGERGLGDGGFKDGSTKVKRTAEEKAVCEMLGLHLLWLDEVDGEAFAGRETCARLAEIYRRLRPRAIIAHWPLDTHGDHVMCSAAAMRAVALAGIAPEVYFQFQSHQSRGFQTAYYVDVTSVAERKRKALSLYACQDGPGMAARKRMVDAVHSAQIGAGGAAEVFAILPGTIPSSGGVLDSLENSRR